MRAFFSAFTCSLLAALAASGCGSSAIPEPTGHDATWAAARWPGTSLADLSTGRDLYVNKCSGCHALYAPERVVHGEFPANVREMGAQIHLTDDETDRIERYLETAARDGARLEARLGDQPPR